MKIIHFPFYRQLDATDCGIVCLRMIAKYYNKKVDMEWLRSRIPVGNEGVSLLSISEGARQLGFKTVGVMVSFAQLCDRVPLPCIAHWGQNHFVVIWRIQKKGKGWKIYVADPAVGLLQYNEEELAAKWQSTRKNDENKGVVLLLEPTAEFFSMKDATDKTSFSYLFSFLKQYKQYIAQVFIGLLVGSCIQLILPFLTQSLVDTGINYRNIHFIYIILLAQLMLFLSSRAVEFVRSWLMLHMSARISLSILSDFLLKLMKLPLRFFDGKMTGDIYQRISDHSRIERFITTETFNVVFSMINLVIFSIVLAFYNIPILLIFFCGSTFYVVWLLLFMGKRKELDYKFFDIQAKGQNFIIELINGMNEIKLNHCEEVKQWEWEHLQAERFNTNVKSLSINQIQNNGSSFINELKNILITFMAAMAVIHGQMSLGMMLAVQYIIGQLNGPLSQALQFIYTVQDARISLERLSEVHRREEEDANAVYKVKQLSADRDIHINQLTFQYEGSKSPKVLDDISLYIPEGKVTAIVGASGSGKTTLIKLILGFYSPVVGSIYIGDKNLDEYSINWWRSSCGTVMQDGYIFSDTIAKNIAMCMEEQIDTDRLKQAVDIANISEFIETLPLKYNTKIGQEGVGLSQGQKQRILIARAVYKNPAYILFDEATNSLDASNEKIITQQLNRFFTGRTVVIVAHRLSTVRNAHQIVVLEQGRIVESGTHDSLIQRQGAYYNLIKDQLELGNS
ncbi:MAG: peptidase domain-containing ABC transporter [Candidatus Azobacteroides sp.]|nr:peptidase domain-containing ABC transporter [Candidatus Azobacteroides sp.]